MDSEEEEEEHEARLRSEQRAIGRTPAEHAALETALAQRRRRRQRDKQDSENEYYRVLLQRQRREQQQREQREQQEQQQQRLATYLQQQQQQQQQREQQMRMQAGWLTVRRQQSTTTTTTTTGFERALERMRDRVEAEAEVGIQGPSPPPPLPSRVNAPRRTGRVSYSSRKARGAGWHRRGYRDSGDLWINVREGSYGSVKGRDENENETLRAFVRHVFGRFVCCSPLPPCPPFRASLLAITIPPPPPPIVVKPISLN